VDQKPPPILFLTVLHTDAEGMEAYLKKIKQHWGEMHEMPMEDAQVDWIRKWDLNAYEKLVRRLRDWGEVSE